MKMEEDYDEYEDNEEDEALMLSIEDGKLTEYKPEDYVEMKRDELELIKGFIEKHKDLFDKYISENKKEIKHFEAERGLWLYD